ncbi:MAG TPA: DUF58 domain-containing protein [Chloroflexota bacterium]|nr:DUF58 domain-containing protein [Chloroflexota bacterium]
MFGPGALVALGALLALGMATHQAPLTLLSTALLLASLLSQVWRRYCLTGVEYRRRLGKRRAAFGETIDMEVEIVNRKPLPLTWLRIFDEMPEGARPTKGRVYLSHLAGRVVLDSVVALRPFERVRRRHPIPCTRRGGFEVGPVRLSSGDLFGLVTRDEELPLTDAFVVWPRIVPLRDQALPARQPLGELRTHSWLFEDPARIAGAREYRPGDPTRRVHWPASVRAQRLLAKVYEPTTSRRLVVLLNLHPAEQWTFEGYDPDVVEFTIMAAASVVSWACDAGYQVGLMANGIHRRGDLGIEVRPAAGATQRVRLLDALGMLDQLAVHPFERTVAEAAPRLRYGTTVVAVSGALGRAGAERLSELPRRGHPTALIHTGAGRPAVPGALRGVTVRRAGPARQWRELPEIRLSAAGGAGAANGGRA